MSTTLPDDLHSIRSDAEKRIAEDRQLTEAVRRGDVDAAVKHAKRLAHLYGNHRKSSIGAAALVFIVQAIEKVTGK